MLGRMKVSLPVCSSSSAPPWRELDPYIDLMKQRSSVISAILGKTELTQAPLWPCCLKAQGDFSRLPVAPETIRGLGNGNGLPWSLSSCGLWSKVSTCEGPPCMNRKMTRLARAGK